jgi:hypothetical protein
MYRKFNIDDADCTAGVWPPRAPVDNGWVRFQNLGDGPLDLYLQRMLNLWIDRLSDSAKRRVIAELWLSAGNDENLVNLPSDPEIAEHVLTIRKMFPQP